MATVNKVLRKGSKGQEVKLLQSLLNQKVPVPKLPQGRKLVEDGDFGNNTDAAVRTFQQQNRLTVDGIVGGKTWAALGVQFVGAPVSPGSGGSTLVQLPQSGSGYYSYGQSHEQYGTAETIKTIQEVARTFCHNMPNIKLGIGHISLAQGGHFPPHQSHQRGTDIDIRPLRNDGQPLQVTIHDVAYSQDYTRLLVESLLAHQNVKKILFNDKQISGVTYYSGHDNHLHVSTKA